VPVPRNGHKNIRANQQQDSPHQQYAPEIL
jgi:hypothetical protein